MRLTPPLMICLLLSGLALGQTGDITPTAIELSSMRSFVPAKIELIEQPSVDLRPWMPPVGLQRMNDCTAWAVAYGAKSYAEARDQGWKPDRASRQFNPQFVYNQINGGTDKGSNFIQAIRLMAKAGAATLATGPYRPGDFRTQPNTRQRTEAAAFPVHDGIMVKNRLGIRRALQRREVVIFGANVGPTFLGGRFKTYTKDLFYADSVLRKPGQPHGQHAMVVVGYDDKRGAFLIQNSWGTNWGWRGFAWVAYDLFDRIKADKSGSHFCRWACMLMDVEEPIVYDKNGLPRASRLDLSTIKIKGHSDIVRYDKKRGQYVYAFTASLRGQREALKKIKRVTWYWRDEKGKEARFNSDQADMQFPVQAGTNDNPLKIRCAMLFHDGTVRTVKAEITGPNAKADFRLADIYFKDDYFSSRRGFPVWEVKAMLDYPLEQRLDIVKVDWDMGSGSVKARKQTMTGFNGPVAEESPTSWLRGPSKVTARIHYNDGGIKTVSRMVHLKDKVENDFHLDITSRPIGVSDSGETLYAARLTIDYPKLQRLSVDKVYYTVDPHISTRELVGYEPWGDYQVFVKSDRDFRVTARVEFQDKRKRTFTQWVKLGPDSAYKSGLKLGIRSSDVYQGSFIDRPNFMGWFEIIGDLQVVSRIKEARLFFKPDDPNDKGVIVRGDQHRYRISHPLTGDAQKVKAVIDFGGGQSVTLHKTHKRIADRHDGIGLHIKTQKRPRLETMNEPELTLRVEAKVSGPKIATDYIHSIDWFHTVGKRRVRTNNRTNRFRLESNRRLKSSFSAPFSLSAYVGTIDGFGQLIEVPITATTGGDQRDDAQLRLKEKFWDYEDGRPLWLIEARVLVNESVYPGKITSFKIKRRARDGQEWKELSSKNGALSYLVREAHDVRAEVVFDDGKTLNLEASAPLLIGRPELPQRIVSFRSGADAFPWECVMVEAWEKRRREISRVHFDFVGDKSDKTVDYTVRPETMILTMYKPKGPEDVTVTVTYKDGRVVSSTAKIGVFSGLVSTRCDVRYWGKGRWEGTLIPTGDWIDIGHRDVWHLGIDTGLFTETAHAWPPGIERARLSKPRALKVTPRVSNSSRTAIRQMHQIGPAPGQTTGWMTRPPESLRLVVEKPGNRISKHAPDERTIYIFGPESLMIQIAEVEYAYKIGGRDVKFRVKERFGELQEGFENSIFVTGESLPDITAVVTLRDGKRVKLKGQRGRF